MHVTFLRVRPIISLEQQQQQSQVSRNKQSKGNRASTRKNKPSEIYGYEQPIPTCRDCGTPLRFELQILPSILHVLHVDDSAVAGESGGMDWGNICVYTCPNQVTKCRSNEAFCIVQDSIDHIHLPNKNSTSTNSIVQQQQQSTSIPAAMASAAAATAVVVIPEHTHFDHDDDDDGIVLVGDEYDNECEDDDSVW